MSAPPGRWADMHPPVKIMPVIFNTMQLKYHDLSPAVGGGGKYPPYLISILVSDYADP